MESSIEMLFKALVAVAWTFFSCLKMMSSEARFELGE
jgi:hypothetical protein